ncbi:hypothetical protein BKA67DRAFT_568281 [Truncatella angustata]|uniref:Secreted protein n=1 Tax=Truncatella angustata TaxID=152316 RepID=A0A9P8UJ01_9PEZI|nr:uncharacterized protein BKA67DRAFT_568281 [Truncatella angustata]KAH6653001.1 hypothetical protein BKA67DRAFT_568281 [Truncatella angustata]
MGSLWVPMGNSFWSWVLSIGPWVGFHSLSTNKVIEYADHSRSRRFPTRHGLAMSRIITPGLKVSLQAIPGQSQARPRPSTHALVWRVTGD